MKPVKCVVVGDGAVGKTSLLLSYSQNIFASDYTPTIFDNYSVTTVVDGAFYNLSLWDTAGQEDYSRLRPLSYPMTDVFLVCFSVTNPSSFRNAADVWIPEVTHYCPSVPIVLCGTKADSRTDDVALKRLTDRQQSPVTEAEARRFADSMRVPYVECSALTQQGVKQVFDTAIRQTVPIGTKSSNKRKRQCLVL
jgi:Ras-related C3 botulinum toxin substrate 1